MAWHQRFQRTERESMILQALITQIQQRFSHEKRARVCLWFDPQGEFERLLPALASHLGQMKKSP